MTGNTTSKGMAEPPEGAIVGENVPIENQEHQFDETLIEETMATLKTLGKPYMEMNDTELEERAVETLQNYGVDL